MTVATKAPPAELIDQILAGYQRLEDLIGEHGLLKQLAKAAVERALQAEMVIHLGMANMSPLPMPLAPPARRSRVNFTSCR